MSERLRGLEVFWHCEQQVPANSKYACVDDKLRAFIDSNGKHSEISTPTRSHTLHVPGEKYTLLGIGPKALWLVSYDFKLRMIAFWARRLSKATDVAQEEPDSSDFGILEEYVPPYFQLE